MQVRSKIDNAKIPSRFQYKLKSDSLKHYVFSSAPLPCFETGDYLRINQKSPRFTPMPLFAQEKR